MKLHRPLLLLAVIALGECGISTLTGTLGCAALTAALPTVANVVSDATAILGLIEGVVAAVFRSSPNPTMQTQIEAGLQRAQLALIAGEQALAGISNASAGQIKAAFASFAVAYVDLMRLVAPLGIVPATTIAPAPDGGPLSTPPGPPRLVVPTPQVLRL